VKFQQENIIMAESPRERPISLDKETLPIAPANSDVELGDPGILVHAAPLARKLKGRHMQMIAIGNYVDFLTVN
jgi:amino acid transporter